MARINLSVTELKQMVLNHWSFNGEPIVRSTGQKNLLAPLGLNFHKLAERFVVHLAKSNECWADDEIKLWGSLWDNFASAEIRELTRTNPDLIVPYGEALRYWCGRLWKHRQSFEKGGRWSEALFLPEKSYWEVLFESKRGPIHVSGRPDLVRRNPDETFVIIDYKLSRGPHFKADLIQLAIYAKLLCLEHGNIGFQGALEYYEPELNEVEFSKDQMEAIFTELVQPILDGAQKTNTPHPGLTEPTNLIDVKKLGDQLCATYAAHKLAVSILDHINAPQLIRFKLQPGSGVKVVSLAARAEDLQVALSLEQPPFIESGKGFVAVDILKPKPDIVLWKNAISRPEIQEFSFPLIYPIGLSVAGKILVADFENPNYCHALVAGVSGSGKSEYLKSVIASLAHRLNPDSIKFTLIDPKLVTFSGIDTSPYLTGPVIHSIQDAVDVLKNSVTEMDARYELLSQSQCANISEYRKKVSKGMFWRIIIMDEFADLILGGKETKKEFETLTSRIVAKGRAAGIHLILATQRPDAKVVTGQIKANLPLLISFRVTNRTNSQVILDENGAETLAGRGDMLVKLSTGLTRAQSSFISHDLLLHVLKCKV